MGSNITLVSSSVAPTSTTFEANDNDSGTGTDTVTFDIDLTNSTSATITGDFDDESGGDPIGYNFAAVPLFGEFALNRVSGEFAYTVSRDRAAELAGPDGVVSASAAVSNDAVLQDSDDLIFNITVCYGRGTLIATPEGERRVEELTEGDLVLTADGRAVPVLWMGVNAISPMFRPADRLEPVLIRAGALAPVLGQNLPRRDLVVTADHGMVLGDHVVNASALVGAPGITFLDYRRLGSDFAYYHIETEGHEVVLAEGAPSETYVDYVGRRSFDNYADYEARYGAERMIAEMDRPRVSSLRLLPDALRAKLGIADDRSAEAALDAAFERAA